jgi:hypothetical protein
MMRAVLVVPLALALDWTLGMQLCPEADEWTLHGLWPNNDDCSGPTFDHSAISSIESELEAKWPSCYPSHGGGDETFWQHEWQKHGTCSGMNELNFFTTALALQGKFEKLCEGWKDTHACELPCTGSTASDIQCSGPQSAPVQIKELIV